VAANGSASAPNEGAALGTPLTGREASPVIKAFRRAHGGAVRGQDPPEGDSTTVARSIQ